MLEAQILQRRAENALGIAIRDGQIAGTIQARTQGGDRRSKSTEDFETLPSPTDFATHTELYGNTRDGSGNGTYALASARESPETRKVEREAVENIDNDIVECLQFRGLQIVVIHNPCTAPTPRHSRA